MRVHIPKAREGFMWVMWVKSNMGDLYRVDGNTHDLEQQAELLKKLGMTVIVKEERIPQKFALEHESHDNEDGE